MTTIVSVEPRPNGFWRITDAEGVRYMTKNAFVAALADRCRIKGTLVSIGSSAGWYYRDISCIRTDGGEMEIA